MVTLIIFKKQTNASIQDSRCAVRDFLVKHTKEEILKHKTETVDDSR